MMLLSALACSPKSKTLKLAADFKNCCEMMPDIATKDIAAQRDILSPEVFAFLIQAKATKTCACIQDETKQNLCYEKFR